MNKQQVCFTYYPGVFGDPFPHHQAELHGNWLSAEGTTLQAIAPMHKVPAEDGGIKYQAEVALDTALQGTVLEWGVKLNTPSSSQWGIPTEVNDAEDRKQTRPFVLTAETHEVCYYLTRGRYLGVNKHRKANGTWITKFRVWAPHAQAVEVVFGGIRDLTQNPAPLLPPGEPLPRTKIGGGYIDEQGNGILAQPLTMARNAQGVWETDDDEPLLQGLAVLQHSLYMYRIVREDGSVRFRTDLYARMQAGFGEISPLDPETPYHHRMPLSELSGTPSCSVALDPECIPRHFRRSHWPPRREDLVPPEEFWAEEFNPDKPLPRRVEDLIIYQLHLGSLDFGARGHGTFEEALALLDHIEGLNVNAIKLLPLNEFQGHGANWGYATSHYFAIEDSTGGREQFKHFVRACHRRGIAVILDVVYNHYAHYPERAQGAYDSPLPEHDIYYWYEGQSADYQQQLANDPTWGKDDAWKEAGYINNMSTGFAPRYHEEWVRQLFISSAVALVREFHIDGLRVDQTTSMHAYSTLNLDNAPVARANHYGAKFLRELGRTLRLFKPDLMLIAEDHSTWDEVTKPVEAGGMGFDARWYSEFYHNLIGDTHGGTAKLLRTASLAAPNEGLPVADFAQHLYNSKDQKVVYVESHDEAGNSSGPFFDPKETNHAFTSHRTITVAVNGAPLVGETLRFAEARVRFAWGVTVLSAGTPMFLFGEEVGVDQRLKYRYQDTEAEMPVYLQHQRETAHGQRLYRYYAEINRLRRSHAALRSRHIDIVHVTDATRTLVFRRWAGDEQFLVFATLADRPFDGGYVIDAARITQGRWKEVFNSDTPRYGGNGVSNPGGELQWLNGGTQVQASLPFAGLVVFAYQGPH